MERYTMWQLFCVVQHSYEALKAVDDEMDRLLYHTYFYVTALLECKEAPYDELIYSLTQPLKHALSGAAYI